MPIGGLLDALMGKNSFTARGATLNTQPGQRAIQQQANQAGQQAQSQQYSLAASANNPLAFREAQRMGVQAQGQIAGDALAQQQALQQAALQQQMQAQMQAQQINAQIAGQNAQGVQRLAGTALMGAALMSDENQKEFYSDFRDKEFSAGSAAFGLNAPQQPMAVAPDTRPIAVYQPQALRPGVNPDSLTNSALAQHFRDQREQELMRQHAADQEIQFAPPVAPPPPQGQPQQSGLMALGQNLMQSDQRAKELAFSQGVQRGMQSVGGPPAPGYSPPPPPVPGPGYGANISQSRADLGPVQPVVYRYNPESSARQAAEQGTNPAEQAMVFADKRTPRTGIVAQDLQRSPAFAPAVKQTPAGLAVERDRALSAALFELGGLDKRLKQLEGLKKKR